ncbi:TMEM175 family protein [Solilutibacter silvestris]|uniref:Integral membrane protein n=1 Tax=Solilutibacter silvestris TaxID=1645665 RepID=A0A2K1Q469_9GAMM|nr:TMEM175 family protein [Lysobacter silvestris]PNS09801.1 hypothetical protein Lysil_1430 [Lysobacter silvestris]
MSSSATPATPGTDLFPHERVVFFSDAVFAIAITLLAIELKLPGHDTTDAAAAVEITATFIAYFVSFMVTGVFWTSHMLTWKHVTRVNGGMVWLTLMQLMFVALMPFATREYSLAIVANDPWRSAMYAAVLMMISFFSLRTRLKVVRQEDLRDKIGFIETRWFIARGVIPLCIFAVMVPLAFVVPPKWIALVFFLIFPLLKIVRRRIFQSSTPALESPHD